MNIGMQNFSAGLLAGLVATVVLSALMVVKNMMGLMPELDIAVMIGMMTIVMPMSGAVLFGMILGIMTLVLHIVFGSALGAVYQMRSRTLRQ